MKNVRIDHDVVNFVYTTDWHLSDVAPGKRLSTYREEILAKLDFSIALANKINAISLCGGDVYHAKNPFARGNSFSLQTRLENTLRRCLTGTEYGTHGNHDISADRQESIPHQPFGTLVASGAFTDLSTESAIFENRDGTIRVQVDAYPFTSDDMMALDRVLHAPPRAPGVDYRIVLMHQYGAPGDAPTLFGHPIIGFDRMAECDYDVALWGHDHSRTETVQVGNCTHVRLGSLSRASLAEDEVDRPISAAIFSFTPEGIRYQEKVIPAKPLHVAFTVADRLVEKVRESDDVTNFFTRMDKAVADIESNDARQILRDLVPVEELSVYLLACELCGF